MVITQTLTPPGAGHLGQLAQMAGRQTLTQLPSEIID